MGTDLLKEPNFVHGIWLRGRAQGQKGKGQGADGCLQLILIWGFFETWPPLGWDLAGSGA